MISGKVFAHLLAGSILGAALGLVSATPAVAAPLQPPAAPAGALQVYFIDVEGGQSTLFVTPDHHSLLVDTGWPGHDGRDAKRIQAAMRMAGIDRLDAVLLTHFHVDHVGDVPQLVALVPVGEFLDHGPNRETGDAATEQGYEAYQRVLASGKYKHFTLHPGQSLPVPGFRGTVVSGDGQLIQTPLPGAGQANPFCADAGQKTPDVTENARSLGFVLLWGRARILDLGDLTRDKEKQLMCPVNRIGHIDLLVVSHHGWYQSSSAALVDAITPRVAVMDNGATKGGSIPVLKTLKADPSHPALWQLHFSEEGGSPYNTPQAQIANLDNPQHSDDAGYPIRATVQKSGVITVWNGRTGAVRIYAASAKP
jgi:beta-lactamase superfamily II metal-dependent hydrolase